MKVLLIGHSYVRDLGELGIREYFITEGVQVELLFLSRPGGTFSDLVSAIDLISEVKSFHLIL